MSDSQKIKNMLLDKLHAYSSCKDWHLGPSLQQSENSILIDLYYCKGMPSVSFDPYAWDGYDFKTEPDYAIHLSYETAGDFIKYFESDIKEAYDKFFSEGWKNFVINDIQKAKSFNEINSIQNKYNNVGHAIENLTVAFKDIHKDFFSPVYDSTECLKFIQDPKNKETIINDVICKNYSFILFEDNTHGMNEYNDQGETGFAVISNKTKNELAFFNYQSFGDRWLGIDTDVTKELDCLYESIKENPQLYISEIEGYVKDAIKNENMSKSYDISVSEPEYNLFKDSEAEMLNMFEEDISDSYEKEILEGYVTFKKDGISKSCEYHYDTQLCMFWLTEGLSHTSDFISYNWDIIEKEVFNTIDNFLNKEEPSLDDKLNIAVKKAASHNENIKETLDKDRDEFGFSFDDDDDPFNW